METIFDNLLFIKEAREESALKYMRQARQDLTKAKDNVVHKEEALQEYIKWREAEEVRLYSMIDDQPIKLKEMEEFQARIALMRGRDSELSGEIIAAKEAANKAQEALSCAEAAYQKAATATNKFVELSQQNKDLLFKEAEYKEDLELEEFTCKKVELLG